MCDVVLCDVVLCDVLLCEVVLCDVVLCVTLCCVTINRCAALNKPGSPSSVYSLDFRLKDWRGRDRVARKPR